jgi:hypothetical protein
MDLEKLKGKTIDDALLADLKAHVDGLETLAEKAEGKAKAAQKESIEGRKQLKAERDAAFDKLGVTTIEEIEALPDAKGQADAVKQVETKLKKAEAALAEEKTAHETLRGELATERRSTAIAKAAAKHNFIDAEDAATLIGSRVKANDDGELMFTGADGKLVKLDDGVAWLAKSKPHLVKPAGGTGGTGNRPGGAQGNGGAPEKKPERKDYQNDIEFTKAETKWFRGQNEASATH